MKDQFEEFEDDLDLDQSQGVLNATLRNVGIILIVCIVLAVVVGISSGNDDSIQSSATQPSQTSSAAAAKPAAAANLAAPRAAASQSGASEIVIPAGAGGHFKLTAEINGDAVDFLVDTGASHIILSRGAAEQAGIFLSEADFTQSYQTANGIAKAAPVVLRSLRIGEIEMYDLEASVMERDMTVSLLGMSFLNRLVSYEVRDQKLVLAW